MDTFLTEAKGQVAERNPQLETVRKENKKLVGIVATFGLKVENMIDKQRTEYVTAYGHHMRDVQKELHLLREKATAIANDRTRDEKIKKLDSDQKWYRTEAIRLDSETNVLRKKLKSLTATISSVERERDWLLTKLREAKGKYNELQHARSQKGNGMEEGMSLLSNDSSYTLEFGHNTVHSTKLPHKQQHKTGQWKSRLENDYAVTRDHAMIGALSHMIVSTDNNMDAHSVSTMGHQTQQVHALQPLTIKKNLKSRRTLGKLVAARAKQEALGDFVGQCANSCSKGSFSALGKQKSRSLDHIIDACMQHLANTNHNPASTAADYYDTGGNGAAAMGSSHFHALVKELACHHDTYVVISDYMSGVLNQHPPRDSPTNMSPPSSPSHLIQDYPGVGITASASSNDIAYTNISSSDLFLHRPVTASTVGDTMKIDRDIAGYLNMGSERRLARREKNLLQD